MDNIKFNHITPIQLRFNDFDALGHVNNSVYFSFYDLGKTTYFNEVLPDVSISKEVGVVIANIEVSFQLLQRLIDIETNEVKCICQTVMVCYDAKTKTSRSISDKWRKAMADFEGNKELGKVQVIS